jgi:hypothetical protein
LVQILIYPFNVKIRHNVIFKGFDRHQSYPILKK